MALISVIGAEGFIGSHICKKLNIEGLDIKSGFDVRNEIATKEAIKDSGLIFNLASVAGVDNVENDPLGCIETNIVGTLNILKHKKGKLVYFSTSEVYGKYANRNTEEEVLWVEPPKSSRWSYQVSKLCTEHLIMTIDPGSLIIRPFNVFGEGQSLKRKFLFFKHHETIREN